MKHRVARSCIASIQALALAPGLAHLFFLVCPSSLEPRASSTSCGSSGSSIRGVVSLPQPTGGTRPAKTLLLLMLLPAMLLLSLSGVNVVVLATLVAGTPSAT